MFIFIIFWYIFFWMIIIFNFIFIRNIFIWNFIVRNIIIIFIIFIIMHEESYISYKIFYVAIPSVITTTFIIIFDNNRRLFWSYCCNEYHVMILWPVICMQLAFVSPGCSSKSI